MGKTLDRFNFLLDNLGEGVYFVDNERKIEYWNEAAEELTGFSKEEVLGKYCYDNIMKHIDCKGVELCNNGCPLAATAKDGKMRKMELYLHHKEGHRVPVTVKAIPVMDDNQTITGAIEIFYSNVSQMHKEKILELEKLAMTDGLTGVANRLYTEKTLGEKIEIFKINKTKFALAFIDVDYFKKFNDNYGHDVGDKVLKVVASTLAKNINENEFIGRWGGEEFVIILEVATNEILATRLNILRILIEKSELIYNEKALNVTVSIGGAIIKENDSKDDLVKNADSLMYQSKKNGRNRVTV